MTDLLLSTARHGSFDGNAALAWSPPQPLDPEVRLLARLRAGDAAAFDAWVRAESPRLLATLRRLLRDEEDARDALQDSFLQAFRSLETFAGASRLSTWLHRIAINTGLMQLRRRKRRAEESLDALLPRFGEDGGRIEAGPCGPAQETPLEQSELAEVIQECYARLPERYRMVLLLRDVEGFDTRETSEVLGVGVDAVKMRLHRARQALRALLEPYISHGLRPGTSASA